VTRARAVATTEDAGEEHGRAEASGSDGSDAEDADDAFEREVLAEMTRAVEGEGAFVSEGETKRRRVDGERMSGLGAFAAVPEDAVDVVLRFLSPNELTSLGQTCTFFARACDQDFLWRQCFIERFGNVKQARSSGMKRVYFLADAIEIERERRKAPEGFERICAEAVAAKRSHVCSKPAPLCGHVAADLVASAWKSRRTFDTDTTHVCSRRAGCSYQELPGKVFVCEGSGRVHVCDETCRERQVDTDLGTEICQISGASFDTVLQDDENDDDQTIADQEQHYFEKGYFGRAFEVGYGCDNETELQTALWGGPTRGGY